MSPPWGDGRLPLPRRSTSGCTGRAGAGPRACSGSLCEPGRWGGGRQRDPGPGTQGYGLAALQHSVGTDRHTSPPVQVHGRHGPSELTRPSPPHAGASLSAPFARRSSPGSTAHPALQCRFSRGALGKGPSAYPRGPYPGNLCQMRVHVLVADLHHLSDALVVTVGRRGQWVPEAGPRLPTSAPPPHGPAGWGRRAGGTHSSTIFL